MKLQSTAFASDVKNVSDANEITFSRLRVIPG